VGNRITLSANGVPVTDVLILDERHRRLSGVLALQLHAGNPMQIQFKDVWLRELPPNPVAEPEPEIPVNAVNLGREELLRRVKAAAGKNDPTAFHRFAPGYGAKNWVWPRDTAFLALATGQPGTVEIVEMAETDRAQWSRIATEQNAHWASQPVGTMVWKNADDSEGRLPVTSEHGQWRFASLVLAAANPQLHNP
jgi:hypothetical protein